jgi:hypothetical protein
MSKALVGLGTRWKARGAESQERDAQGAEPQRIEHEGEQVTKVRVKMERP